jgi:hypothetical protein
VLIDEGQDAPNFIVKYARLLAGSVNFVGDEAQSGTDLGVGRWSNIPRELPGYFHEINEYRLNHNFRQTAELAQANHNLRELILSRDMTDVTEEYFQHQKGFDKPLCIQVRDNVDIVNHITKKLAFISERFIFKRPLAIIVNSDSDRNKIEKVCYENSISLQASFDINGTEDVFIVDISEVSGREFPVTISVFEPNVSPEKLYIALSRANFDSSNISYGSFMQNEFIRELHSEGVVNLSES